MLSSFKITPGLRIEVASNKRRVSCVGLRESVVEEDEDEDEGDVWNGKTTSIGRKDTNPYRSAH